jgi:hypothetical protein
MSGKKRKIRERSEERDGEVAALGDDTEIGLVQIKKLSNILFSNERDRTSTTVSPSPPPMEDVIEVHELRSEEVILTIEDLVMKFVKQILLDGSCSFSFLAVTSHLDS